MIINANQNQPQRNPYQKEQQQQHRRRQSQADKTRRSQRRQTYLHQVETRPSRQEDRIIDEGIEDWRGYDTSHVPMGDPILEKVGHDMFEISGQYNPFRIYFQNVNGLKLGAGLVASSR